MKCGFEAVIEAQRAKETRPSAAPLSLRFKLPWPPSVNTYWRNIVIGGSPRVLISRDGREYRVRALEALMVQRVPKKHLTGRLAIYVIARPPDRRKRDLSNLWKAFEDALQHADVIEDDSDFDDMRIMRGAVVADGELEIVIDEIPGEATSSGKLFSEPP